MDRRGFVGIIPFILIVVFSIFLVKLTINAVYNIQSNEPSIQFVFPTPADGSTQSSASIFVNLSTNDVGDHYAFVDFDRDLMLWMRMDDINASGDPTDLSSYSNNGSSINGAAQNASGKFGKSFSFDGADDYINNGRITQLEGAENNYTISLWIKRDPTIGVNPLLWTYDRDDGAGNDNANLDLYLFYATGSGLDWGLLTGCQETNSNTALEDGNWHQITTVSHLSSIGSTGELYVDGVLVQTITSCAFTWNSVATDYKFRLGHGENIDYWKGNIDDVLIFNRSLSASEIASLYNAFTTQYEHNFIDLSSGNHTFIGSAVDASGNINRTEKRTVNIDLPPSVTIVYPKNIPYNYVVSALNYTANDNNLDSCWYSIDGGGTNLTVTCGENVTGLTANEGSNTWTVYANDSVGNKNLASVIFTVDTTPPNINFADPTSAEGSSQSNIFVNLSSFDSSNYYTFLDLDRSLNLWMRMDDINASGDPTDLSRYSNNGTAKNGAVQNTTSGKFGKSFSFDGVNDYVQLPNIMNYSSKSITFSFWSNPYDISLGGRIFDDADGANQQGFTIDVGPSSLNVNVVGNTGYDYMITPYSENNIWTHWAITYEFLTANATIYKNGVLVNSKILTSGTSVSPIYAPVLGLTTIAPVAPYSGLIDEFLIFNRSLSDAEVLSLYNASANQYSNNFTDLSGGNHTFIGHAVDALGNKNQTETRTVTILPDTIPPNIQFVNPTEANNSVIGRRNIIINATATDAHLANITIRLFNSTDLVNETMTITSPNFVNITDLLDGVYFFNATAIDSAGNANDTETRTITVDATPPQVNITSPIAGTIYTVNSYAIDIKLNEAGFCEYTLDNGITNNSLTANSSNTGFTGTRSGVVNSLYTFKAYCNDSLGNKNYTVGVDFGVSVSASAASSGGGSSGGGGGGGAIYNAYENQLGQGYTREYTESSVIKFTIEGGEHKLEVIGINTNEALVAVSSTPQVAILKVNETKKFDLTNDRYYDLKATLNSIREGKANITLTLIHEKVEVAQEVAAQSPEAPKEEKKPANFNYIVNIGIESLKNFIKPETLGGFGKYAYLSLPILIVAVMIILIVSTRRAIKRKKLKELIKSVRNQNL